MSRQPICIKPSEFIADKLVISEPEQIKTRNKKKLQISGISYLNNKDEPSDLYLSLPTVETYGPFPQYNFNSSSKSANDICGYTISYSNEDVRKLFKTIEEIIG